MRKETSNKTLSSSVTKVQKTMSNFSTPNNQSAILYLCITIKLRKNVLLFIPLYGLQNCMRNLSQKIARYLLLIEK